MNAVNSCSRPHTAVFLGISLDGFIAGPNGDLSWLSECAGESPAETGYDELLSRVDTHLIGRQTYESVLAFAQWPYAGQRVKVLTHRPLEPRFSETACHGPIEQVLARLGAEGARGVYLDGGQVVRQALAAGLVDELTLSWVPVMLGGGVRLFDAAMPRSQWQLVGSRSFKSGMLQGRYAARAVT